MFLDEDEVDGLVSVVGVKYTTAREVAERAVDMILDKLDPNGVSPASTTAQTPLFGGNFISLQSILSDAQTRKYSGLSSLELANLVYNYGREYETILFLMDSELNHQETKTATEKMIIAQVQHAVRDEMAVTLIDVIRRRLDLGSAEYPGDELVNVCAKAMAEELNWGPDKINEEVQAVAELYTPFASSKRIEAI